uniref:Uncharacterized protein n=1 Tax=Romanomermis culicivorax TaxID=13658 RepID=A0A915KVR7_ROMCU
MLNSEVFLREKKHPYKSILTVKTLLIMPSARECKSDKTSSSVLEFAVDDPGVFNKRIFSADR